MVGGSMLKFFGEFFYLIVGICGVYGVWNLIREYRTINSTVIKTHITAYRLQKMVESRSR